MPRYYIGSSSYWFAMMIAQNPAINRWTMPAKSNKKKPRPFPEMKFSLAGWQALGGPCRAVVNFMNVRTTSYTPEGHLAEGKLQAQTAIQGKACKTASGQKKKEILQIRTCQARATWP